MRSIFMMMIIGEKPYSISEEKDLSSTPTLKRKVKQKNLHHI